MLFHRRIDKILDVKNIEKRYREEEREPLEKGDLLAMVIAAMLVFFPVVLVLAAVVYGLYWLFVH